MNHKEYSTAVKYFRMIKIWMMSDPNQYCDGKIYEESVVEGWNR